MFLFVFELDLMVRYEGFHSEAVQTPRILGRLSVRRRYINFGIHIHKTPAQVMTWDICIGIIVHQGLGIPQFATGVNQSD